DRCRGLVVVRFAVEQHPVHIENHCRNHFATPSLCRRAFRSAGPFSDQAFIISMPVSAFG
ncbi:MAG: hypothetical protein VZR13_01610, partial [Saccharofermentanaceae bacterium]|nr:hypothetical protein [Saccharofermentanaceae bacterium]